MNTTLFTATIALALGARPAGARADALPPAPRAEVGAWTGLLVGGYTYQGGVVSDWFAGPGVSARVQPAPAGGLLDGALVEGEAMLLAPLRGDGAVAGLATVARLGVALPRVTVSLGVQTRLDPATPAPVAVLPSLAATFRPGPLAVSVGLFDRAAGPLAHLSVAYRGVGLGYAAPLGAQAFARVPVCASASLEVRAFGQQVFSGFSGGAFLGVVWHPGGARP